MLENLSTSFPSDEDVLGCVRAIMRIQEVYQISAKQIADGRLSNKTTSPKLNAEHCFEIGFAYYKWENYRQAYGWLMEGLRRLDEPFEYHGPLERVQVLEFLAWTEYMVTFIMNLHGIHFSLLPFLASFLLSFIHLLWNQLTSFFYDFRLTVS